MLGGQQDSAMTAEITLKSGVWDGQLYALFICYNVYFLIQFQIDSDLCVFVKCFDFYSLLRARGSICKEMLIVAALQTRKSLKIVK